ncbi:hypothetical protein MPSEU_000892000 [Mayamaea pseudoterrestris]|nr:hypothetical protein MPSEU_000892000 [Mayamaea pseudoterrestris]
MSTPIVVQGTAVQQYPSNNQSNPYATSGNNDNHHHAMSSETPESKRVSGCKDPIFALLFYICIAAIVAVAAIYGGEALVTSQSDSGVIYKNYVWAVVVIVFISFIGAGGGLAVMMCCPATLIKVSLIFSVVMAGVWAVLAFLSGSIGVGVIGVVFFLISCCYAYAVWQRIPFAAINMVTAITAVKANMGVAIYAYLITAIAGAYSMCWSIAFVGVFDKTYSCDANNVCTDPNYGYLFLLFVAFFFGQQVFQYTIHVIVAGTVASWWYDPSDSGCCSSAVNNSAIRAFTTSFGSICFGSLVVAIIQALKMLANTAQNENGGSFLACIAECLLACLASIVEYLNRWAFIYVGIYGFGYIESAKNVFGLFRNRGWDAIIADDLVANTLLLVSLVVGAIMGGVNMLIQTTSGVFDSTDGSSSNALVYAFVIGFVVGLVITSILLSLVGSGVNAVIVLFAEAPAEFQQNHPDLSNKMRAIWSQVYPGSV